jgi:hypothetical protein
MWAEADAAPPKLVVNHAVAAVAKGSEAKVEPSDKNERGNSHEQDYRWKAADY